MELMLKIKTDDYLSIEETAQLAEESRKEKVPVNQLATDFIREGLKRRLEASASQES